MLFESTGLVLGLYFLLPSCLATSGSPSQLSTIGTTKPLSKSSRSFTTTKSLSHPSAPAQPSLVNFQLALDSSGTQRDLDTLNFRRRGIIVNSIIDANFTSTWIATMGRDGKWPDVDYTTGCKAQAASWPAYFHWKRLGTLSAVYAGPVPGATSYYKDPILLSTINRGIDFWFRNDFTNPACLDSGGTKKCPCSTPGLWNTNWFSSIILIPKLVARSCLMLGSSLTATQASSCTNISLRAYGALFRSINGVGTMAGANLLDVASVGVDQGIFTRNVSLLQDAYQRMHMELAHIKTGTQDGIHSDGGFEQHGGLLYSGNYGKDYLNDVVAVEIPAAGTQFQAGSNSQQNLALLIDADTWMVIYNTLTGVMHWDLAVVGRFISYPVADMMATAQLNTNVTQLNLLGQLWKSSSITRVTSRLKKKTSNANLGSVQGIRVFQDADYFVQRGPGYVTSLKMYSSRTKGAECINGENLLGFHLSDGVLRTYIAGNEYEDIAASMDWNLLPGITIDYGATPLSCSKSGYTGVQSFVGSTSTGNIAAAAMAYENPLTHALKFQKAWFFLENDVQHVLVSSVSSSTSAPVYSVLDQRLHSGDIKVDGTSSTGGNFRSATALWHGNVGYAFDSPSKLVVTSGPKTGEWSSISPSQHPPTTVDLFTAYLDQGTSPLSYRIYPGTSAPNFNSKQSSKATVLQNDAHISAIFDGSHQTLMIVFWGQHGGTLDVPNPGGGIAPFQLTADDASIVIYQLNSNTLTVADPTQQLQNVGVTFTATGNGTTPWGTSTNTTITTNFQPGAGGGNAASKAQVQSTSIAQVNGNSSPTAAPSTEPSSTSGARVYSQHWQVGLIAPLLLYGATILV